MKKLWYRLLLLWARISHPRQYAAFEREQIRKLDEFGAGDKVQQYMSEGMSEQDAIDRVCTEALSPGMFWKRKR